MGRRYDQITPELSQWMGQQPVFFVATAPLSAEGHINCSPKGGDALRVLDPLTVAYQDLTGSGAETLAHLRENGRLVIMFCAFEEPSQILRLHGRGEVVTSGQADFEALLAHFPPHPGTRSIVRLHVARVSDSCGYGVPLMDFRAPREVLDTWAKNKGTAGLVAYRRQKNRLSIDGLPALDADAE
ncbi:MAG: pyridoxamine 5'-phosphate oxidase family protein [Nodosilinea sp.]